MVSRNRINQANRHETKQQTNQSLFLAICSRFAKFLPIFDLEEQCVIAKRGIMSPRGENANSWLQAAVCSVTLNKQWHRLHCLSFSSCKMGIIILNLPHSGRAGDCEPEASWGLWQSTRAQSVTAWRRVDGLFSECTGPRPLKKDRECSFGISRNGSELLD